MKLFNFEKNGSRHSLESQKDGGRSNLWFVTKGIEAVANVANYLVATIRKGNDRVFEI